jgi:copper chaperone CopZ
MKTAKFFMILIAALMLAVTAAVAQDTIPVAKQDTVGALRATPKEEGATPKKDAKKKASEVTFKVNMTCENCQKRIEKHIAWEKGVKDLRVDLDKKLVTVKYDSKKTDEDALKKAIEGLGYTAEKE